MMLTRRYSPQGTGLRIAGLRKSYAGVILSGIDFEHYKSLTAADLARQYAAARREAGRKLIVAPACCPTIRRTKSCRACRAR